MSLLRIWPDKAHYNAGYLSLTGQISEQVKKQKKEEPVIILSDEVEEQPGLLSVSFYTPKTDQFQISPAALPEISHHTVWRTWLFIAYPDEGWLYYQFSLPHLYISLYEVGRMYSFELGRECWPFHSQEWSISMSLLLHHTMWRTWLFIGYSNWKINMLLILITSFIRFSWKRWENVLSNSWMRSNERVI